MFLIGIDTGTATADDSRGLRDHRRVRLLRWPCEHRDVLLAVARIGRRRGMRKSPAPVVWPFPSRAEAAFAEDMLKLFRAAGDDEAWHLLDRMSCASDDGTYREDLSTMLRDALAALPSRH